VKMEIIEELYQVILERRRNPRHGSYVSALLSSGEAGVIEKVREESEELLEAARLGSRDEVVWEAADLLFHVLVLLAQQGVTPGEVEEELRRRRRTKRPSSP